MPKCSRPWECKFDVWAPDHHCKVNNMAFSSYAISFDNAAQELARVPAAQNDAALQEAICRKHGVFLDNITDDEVRHLEMLIEEYARAIYG